MEEKEQLSRIIDLASELRKVLVQESFFNHHPEMRGVIENLASSVENLAELQKSKDENAEDRLRYVLAKMK
ncbi:LemA domain protein, partial [Bacillus thuringiensis]